MKYTPDFSSRFRILKGGKISLVVSALLAGSTMSFAAPVGGSVTSGSATINQNGSVTTINQSTNKASINWQDFSIGKSETVNFVQPSSQSVTLNRVIGASQSLIEGAMNANGQVFLLNPNGVLFANGSQINVGGLVASTLNITDANFQAGNYVFEGNSKNSIINMGTITANNGYVALMGKHVANEGTIIATMGNVQMASGEKISLNLNGNSLVKLTIDQGTVDALVENKGLIKADGGQVYLTTQALNTILDGMVNNTGIIEAQTLNDVKGSVVLYAHGGTANIGGVIDASAPNGGNGGFIETSGKVVNIDSSAKITAGSTYGKGGEWLIDPSNITISAAADANGAWSGGNPNIFTPSADSSTVDASNIVSSLNSGTNVTITTTGAGTQMGNISFFIGGSILKTSGGEATLTLKADNSIILNDGYYIASAKTSQGGNGSKLNVVLWADSDGDGHGAIKLGTSSLIQTQGGNVWIGGGAQSGVAWNGLTVGNGNANGFTMQNGAKIDTTPTGTPMFSSYGAIKITSKGWTGGSTYSTSDSTIGANGRYYNGIDIRNTSLGSGSNIIGGDIDIGATAETGMGINILNTAIEGYKTKYVGTTSGTSDGGLQVSGSRLLAYNMGDSNPDIILNGTANNSASAGVSINNSTITGFSGISSIGSSLDSSGIGIYSSTLQAGTLSFNGVSTNDSAIYVNDSTIGSNNPYEMWPTTSIGFTATSYNSDGMVIEDGTKIYADPTAGQISITATGSVVGSSGGGFISRSWNNELIAGAGGQGLYIQGSALHSGNGVELAGTFSANGGAVTITGTSSNGIGLYGNANGNTTIGSADTLGIALTGMAGGSNHGLYFDVSNSIGISTSTAGYIELIGVGTGTGSGVEVANNGANITAGNGTGVNFGANGLYIYGGSNGGGAGVKLSGEYFAVDSLVTIEGLGGTTNAANNAGHGIELERATLGQEAYNGKNTLGVILNGTARSGNNSGIVVKGSSDTSITTLNNGYVKLIGTGYGIGYGIDTASDMTGQFSVYSGNGGAVPSIASTAGMYIKGTGGATGGGVLLGGAYEAQQSTSGITIIGETGASATDGAAGVLLYGASLNATDNDGTVNITGTAQNSSGNNNGVILDNASIGAYGVIAIEGTGYGTGYGIYIRNTDSNSYSSISSSDGAVALSGFGKTGSSGKNIWQVQTQEEDINGGYYSGALELSGGTSVLLKANGGSIWLANDANDIDGGNYGLSINQGSSSTVDVALVSSGNELLVNSVNVTGQVYIGNTADDITVRGVVQTSDTSSDALTLNAGSSESAGTATGGDIQVLTASGGDIQVGSGGTAKLYTGSQSGTSIGTLAIAGTYTNADMATTLTPTPGAGRYIIYREASNGGSSSGGGSTAQESNHDKQVNDIVVTIVNNTAVKVEEEHHEEHHEERMQRQTAQLLQTIMPQTQGGEHFNLVGMTDGATPAQTVNMEQLQSASKAQGLSEVRVPLGQDSIVDLINGGVNLPKGLSQEFYVIADNTQQDKK